MELTKETKEVILQALNGHYEKGLDLELNAREMNEIHKARVWLAEQETNDDN